MTFILFAGCISAHVAIVYGSTYHPTMSTMIVEIYEALKDAGASEDKAIHAAEAVASSHTVTKIDLLALERQMMLIQSEQKLMKWMIGFNLAFTMAMLWKIFS